VWERDTRAADQVILICHETGRVLGTAVLIDMVSLVGVVVIHCSPAGCMVFVSGPQHLRDEVRARGDNPGEIRYLRWMGAYFCDFAISHRCGQVSRLRGARGCLERTIGFSSVGRSNHARSTHAGVSTL
jgi:hypothetical protein